MITLLVDGLQAISKDEQKIAGTCLLNFINEGLKLLSVHVRVKLITRVQRVSERVDRYAGHSQHATVWVEDVLRLHHVCILGIFSQVCLVFSRRPGR